MKYRNIDLEKIKNPGKNGSLLFCDEDGQPCYGRILLPDENEKDLKIEVTKA